MTALDPATRELILDSLGPLLRATVTSTIPLTLISFVLGLVLALGVALAAVPGRASRPGRGSTSR